MKHLLVRFANGFCYSIAITLVIQWLILNASGSNPLLPEFAARFPDSLHAFIVQLLLVGVMSGITSAGTTVFEARKIGLVIQSILFLGIMLAAWIPVACIAWGFSRYVTSMVTTTVSLVATYAVCWGIQYRLCREDINAINAKLSDKERL